MSESQTDRAESARNEERVKVEIVEISGRREIWINGWTVPLIRPFEADGGTVELIIDQRLGYDIPAGQFENVAQLIADVIAVCWGYGAHPRSDDFDRAARFARVPHPSLAPQHMIGITSVETAPAPEPEDDPRG